MRSQHQANLVVVGAVVVTARGKVGGVAEVVVGVMVAAEGTEEAGVPGETISKSLELISHLCRFLCRFPILWLCSMGRPLLHNTTLYLFF